jgi:hypothetical protein
MSIKAVLRHGVIHPVDPLPPEWIDGQELIVEPPLFADARSELADWSASVGEAAAQASDDQRLGFLHALGDVERDSKDSVRQQWARP